MKNLKNIIDYITGNLNADVKRGVIEEVRKDDEQVALYKKLKIAWALFSSTKKMADYDIERSYKQLQKKIEKEEARERYLSIGKVLKYAAILIVVLGIPLFFYLNKQTETTIPAPILKYTSVVADNGQTSKIILPDSSVVWLNSGTKLTYNNAYSFNNRDLVLEGQAYFSVNRNELIPLTVACSDIKVKVLGTKFDVEAYPNESKINVVLESGVVELQHNQADAFNLKMEPGERAQYNLETQKFLVDKVETEDFTNWKEGYLIFRDSPMSEVVEKLERKFNIDIVIKNTRRENSKFNAKFKDEKLPEILDYIEYSCSYHYRIIDNDELNRTIVEFY
ncbi:FecR domain-containing protein [uncultured Draconibacterium sp.]|uniref:FecR family protein n=1 Tax=uncultured Draconibacterium sp. TaxID=1573823 RepID=UPI002AA915CB|nr:FecR domain-containing protein [uncultured Draconibacterium sp.]